MIKTHRELAKAIAGKKILHMNSYGKDSTLCLDWLYNYANCEKIYSLNFKFLASHPGDEIYKKYLNTTFPGVEFLEEPNPFEVGRILDGTFQSPIEALLMWNKSEHVSFDHRQMSDDIQKELGCDFTCYGISRYESFSRATFFHKKGLVDDNKIFPLGMMSKKQVLNLLKGRKLKVHPSYKINPTTLDSPSYYKMRSSFILNPEYKKQMFDWFPLLELDEYRYEKLLK